VDVQLAPRPRFPAGALALGVNGSDTSNDILHTRSFAHLYTPFPVGTGALYAALQGFEYSSAPLTAQRPRAVSIRAVLGTTIAYVDRSAVRLRVQLLSADGSAQVDKSGLGLKLAMTGGATETADCQFGDLNNANGHFLARCELSAMNANSFTASSVATATLTLSYYNNQVGATVDAGALTLVEQPVWYGAAQLARVRETARPLSPAGAMVTMPASPVYAGDDFTIVIYAHTGGYALETYEVWVDLRTDALAYRSHVGSTLMNGILFGERQRNATHTRLTFSVIGTKSTTSSAQVTANALSLVTVTLRAAPGLGVGRHDGLLGVIAQLFANPGSNSFVASDAGVVVNPTTGLPGTALGSLEVVPIGDVGLLAYGPAGTLPNLAPLTGQEAAFPVKAARVSDDYRLTSSNVAAAAAGLTCDAGALVPAVLAAFARGAPCDVRLTEAQTRGDAAASVQVSFADLSASVGFGVYYPASVSIVADDPVLNRVHTGNASLACDGVPVYQTTRLRAIVDGLDATPLIRFVAEGGAPAAAIVGAAAAWLRGLAPGVATVRLAGRPAAFASATVEVSNAAVAPLRLVPRLVTGVAWKSKPPNNLAPPYAGFAAQAQIAQSLQSEGDYGRVHAAIEWDDGSRQDVGYEDGSEGEALTLGALNVTANAPGLRAAAPSAGSGGFWKLDIVPGGYQQCGELASAEWSICGTPLAVAPIPIYMDLPEPNSVTVSSPVARLTPLGDAHIKAAGPTPAPTALGGSVRAVHGTEPGASVGRLECRRSSWSPRASQVAPTGRSSRLARVPRPRRLDRGPSGPVVSNWGGAPAAGGAGGRGGVGWGRGGGGAAGGVNLPRSRVQGCRRHGG